MVSYNNQDTLCENIGKDSVGGKIAYNDATKNKYLHTIMTKRLNTDKMILWRMRIDLTHKVYRPKLSVEHQNN